MSIVIQNKAKFKAIKAILPADAFYKDKDVHVAIWRGRSIYVAYGKIYWDERCDSTLTDACALYDFLGAGIPPPVNKKLLPLQANMELLSRALKRSWPTPFVRHNGYLLWPSNTKHGEFRLARESEELSEDQLRARVDAIIVNDAATVLLSFTSGR